MEKQEEWAAPMSSSGLVRPAGSSARDAQVTSKPPRPDDSSSTRPEPSMREPCQVVVAERVVAMRATVRPSAGTLAPNSRSARVARRQGAGCGHRLDPSAHDVAVLGVGEDPELVGGDGVD